MPSEKTVRKVRTAKSRLIVTRFDDDTMTTDFDSIQGLSALRQLLRFAEQTALKKLRQGKALQEI